MQKKYAPLIILSLLFSCQNGPTSVTDTKEESDSSTISSTYENTVVDSMEELNAGRWVYDERINPNTGDTDRLAIIVSEQKLFFTKHYEGGSTLSLNIRRMEGKTEVYLLIHEGEFEPKDQPLRIRFGNGKPFDIQMLEAADGYHMVYLEHQEYIIKELKNCSSFEVDAPYYLEGRMKCLFKTDQLNW